MISQGCHVLIYLAQRSLPCILKGVHKKKGVLIKKSKTEKCYEGEYLDSKRDILGLRDSFDT